MHPSAKIVRNTEGPVKVINAIQILRGYAAVSVMIGHALVEAYTYRGVDRTFNEFPLLAGVDVFFVISGLIMYVTGNQLYGSARSIGVFWSHRIIRIVPLYWLFTTLMVLVLLTMSQHVGATKLDWPNVLGSYFFYPVERPGGRVAPVLSPGWTLDYEVLFYFLFGLSLWFRRSIGLALLLVTLALLPLVVSILNPSNTALRFWGDSIVLEFGFGILLGVAMKRLRANARVLPAALLFLSSFGLLLFLSEYELPRFIKGGIPAAAMVSAALLLPTRVDVRLPRWAILIGDSSYALYLCHRFVLRLLTIAFSHVSMEATAFIVLYAATATVLSIAAGVFVHLLIEKPMLRLLRSLRMEAVPRKGGRHVEEILLSRPPNASDLR